MSAIAIFTTIDSREKAQEIANALVERKLAACVQISPLESVFSWQGAIQHEQEFRLLIKTVKSRYADIEAAIRDLHPYDLPAIYAFDMAELYGPFADWIADNARGEQG